MPYDYLPPLFRPSDSRIILLVIDGLGGLPIVPGGPTELEAAHTPNMDRLAAEGTLAQTVPIRPGITPGSGPAHLALFGYDPLVYEIGRGALEATGAGLEVLPGDVAARGNFCTLDAEGLITDRRAGRISSEEAAPLVERLKRVEVPGVSMQVSLVKEYRFAVLMRGENLRPEMEDTDPQVEGQKPPPVKPIMPEAERTAGLFNRWIEAAHRQIADQPKANGLTLRGFATDPNLPNFNQAYGLKAACIAVYPMYRGVSRLVGMDVLDFQGETPEDEFTAVQSAWERFDFFFVHIKKPDSKGEDGDFEGKAQVIAEVDAALPTLLDMHPDVLIITGDHSTPARLRYHTWHPVPFLLWAPATGRPDDQTQFGERACARGGLGTIPALDTLPLALAHAGRLDKFGA